FAAGDVLDFLGEKKHEKARYDLIVLDPPAFAKTQKAVPAALDGYASLHRAALALLPSQGLLVTASCSARVSADEFVGAVKEAADAELGGSMSVPLVAELAWALARAGHATLRFDYRGVGASQGARRAHPREGVLPLSDLDGEVSDLRAAIGQLVATVGGPV